VLITSAIGFIKSYDYEWLRISVKDLPDMNIPARIIALSLTLFIVLLSQISVSFAPSGAVFTKTAFSSGTIVYPNLKTATILKTLVAYSTVSADDAAFIASHFNFVDFDFGGVTGFAQIKALNPNITLIGYADVSHVATWQSYWNTVNQNESWFLHTKYGNTSAYRVINTANNQPFMDFSNSGWRNFIANWCASKLAANPTIDGIFADNVAEAIILGWNQFNVPVTDLPADIVNNWNTYMIGMIQTVKAAIGNRLLVINSPDQNGLFIQYCDGQMIEHFLHPTFYAPTDFSAPDPIDHMSLLERLSATGKIVMAFSGADIPQNPTATDIEQTHQCMLYCLAGFLLASGGKATFGYQMLQFDYTGHRGYWDEMDASIGVPTGAKYNIQGDLWTRDFTNGKVFLNVGDVNTYTVDVAGINYSVAPRSGLTVPS
jgi:hypothetical protein